MALFLYLSLRAKQSDLKMEISMLSSYYVALYIIARCFAKLSIRVTVHGITAPVLPQPTELL